MKDQQDFAAISSEVRQWQHTSALTQVHQLITELGLIPIMVESAV